MKFRILFGCCLLLSAACMSRKEDTTSTAASASASSQASPASSLDAPADVAAAPAGAEKSASGLESKVLAPGTGTAKPTQFDRVKVHYTGWTKDGKRFDSSVERGQPASFSLRQVIKGWTEGLQLMVVGEKRRFWIPGNLAYGDTPRRPGAPSGQLTFDVELLEIIEGPKPPPVPEDVKAAPADAKKTASGLAYKVLTPGTGKDHPTPTSRVRVHYTGWTTAGEMFDSSVVNGRPLTMGLDRVIKGWTEGVPLMVEGEKARFWVPSELAYGDKPEREGSPSGMLVFDIELLSILPTTGPAGSAFHPASLGTPRIPRMKPTGASPHAKPPATSH